MSELNCTLKLVKRAAKIPQRLDALGYYVHKAPATAAQRAKAEAEYLALLEAKEAPKQTSKTLRIVRSAAG